MSAFGSYGAKKPGKSAATVNITIRIAPAVALRLDRSQ